MRGKLYILLVFSMFLGPCLNSQVPYITEHRFEGWLEEIQFEIVLEHSTGLIYLGTQQGLFVYDGFELEKIALQDDKDNRVTALYEDRQKRLWIGNENGQIYQIDHYTVQLWQNGAEISAPIKGFAEEEDGSIWVATYGEGIFCFRDDSSFHLTKKEGLLDNDIYAMVICPQGKIWVGTDNGVNVCSIEGGEATIENLTYEDGLPDEIITEIIVDEQGDLWFGTDDGGICHFKIQTWTCDFSFEEWSYGAISTLALLEDKELWFGTKMHGLIKYELETKELQQLATNNQLIGSKILDLETDSEGNLWILSNSFQLCSTNRQIDFLSTDLGHIQSVIQTKAEQLWVGTQDGLFCQEDEGTPFKAVLEDLNLNVISLYEDQYGILWIGTFGEGIYLFDLSTRTLRKHLSEQDGLTNGSILSMAGTGNKIWLATLGGVTEVIVSDNNDQMEIIDIIQHNQHTALGANFIYKVFIDSQQRIWFGTDGKGISYMDQGQIFNIQEVGAAEINSVYSITEDARGHIWIATDNQGIFEYDGQSFNSLYRNEKIRNKDIASIASDGNGNPVIIYEDGLGVIHPTTHEVTYYGVEAGLEQFEPSLNAVYKDKYGDLWIGATDQVVKFNSYKEDFRIHPLTRLQEVSVSLKPLNFWEENELKYDQNNLLFSFSAAWFSNPVAVRYQYQLEGHDQGWINTRDQQAVYSNLPPGDYTFRVRSSVDNNFEASEVVNYSFSIIRPLWLRWWFVATAILVLGMLIRWGMRVREERLQREALLKKEKIESQFEALKSQINPHFLFNCFNTLVAIIEENPDLAIKYVEELSDYFRNIIQYREKDIIALKEELELVKNYMFLLKERYGENLSLDYQIKPETAFVAPLTLQMLVENAVKHNIISNQKPLKIRIYQNEQYIYVCNNLQPKLVKEVSTGFGLQNINSRYALLTDKKVKIKESEKEYSVGIPIIKDEIN